MTLLSHATWEVDKIEEDAPKPPLKPMVLPTITMSLKVAWKANKVKLEKGTGVLLPLFDTKYHKIGLHGENDSICPNVFNGH
jgi:hypothetical protein